MHHFACWCCRCTCMLCSMVHAHLPKNRVLAIEGVEVGAEGDVELGGVHVLASPCHAHYPELGVLQPRMQLIFKEAGLTPVQ